MGVKIFLPLTSITELFCSIVKGEENLCKKQISTVTGPCRKTAPPKYFMSIFQMTAMIREERSKENKTASASAYFAGGKYIYTKIFNLSEDETRQTLILEFEAVYQNAIVFLNGRQVAERPYGYTNFFVDITGKVIAGTNERKSLQTTQMSRTADGTPDPVSTAKCTFTVPKVLIFVQKG